MEENNKNCRNCAYFLQHYVKDVKGNLIRALNCGHCYNANILPQTKAKRVKTNQPCELWKPAELQVTARKKSIKATLENIESILQKISIALENEEDF